MKNKDLVKLRLLNQQISESKFTRTPDLMKWFCGIQAQDYTSAKSSLGIRLPDSSDEEFELAIAAKEIVRTWPMRGTLHFVAGEDIHWILDLLAPARIKANQFRYKQLNLNKKLLKRCNLILEKILEGGSQLIRNEIHAEFIERGIKLDSIQLGHVIQNAGLEKILCFAVRRGNQFTYTLLDEWVQEKKQMEPDEGLAELAKRYFLSRGPAQIQDFVWWAGIKISDARRAVEIIGKSFKKEIIEGKEYIMGAELPEIKKQRRINLLPAFDEYLISYNDRSASLDPIYEEKSIFNNGVFNAIIIVKGIVLGTWKRTLRKKDVLAELRPFINLKTGDYNEIKKELQLYARFFRKPLVMKDINLGDVFHLHIE